MSAPDLRHHLQSHGIKPSAQRLAIAAYVLTADTHPTAETVWREVRPRLPLVSRATVYNTLNLMVERGLLRTFVLDDGATVFDAHVDPHHHFIDRDTGAVYDLPWDAVDISGVEALEDFEIESYMLVLRGRKRPGRD